MEVLSYVKDTPAIVAFPAALIIIGILIVAVAICWICSVECSTYAIVAIAIGAIMVIGGIKWACSIPDDIYVYARMTDEKSFTEMVKDYDFIEEVAGIYKLRLK